MPPLPVPVAPPGLAAVPTGPGFDVVLLLHVAAAVAALGSVTVSGIQAARVLATARAAATCAGPGAAPAGPVVAGGLATYYAPGVNWVGRTLHGVPLLGLALVGLSRGAYGFGDAWIQWGIGLWVLAAVGAEAVLWPAERRVQAGLGPGEGPSSPGLRRSCRTACSASAVLVALLVAAIVVMVAQP